MREEGLYKILEGGLEEKLYGSAYFCAFNRSKYLIEAGSGGGGPSSVFDIASITKPFTALVFSKLVSERIISENAILGDLTFMDVPGDKKNISLLDMLSHSSGLPSYRPFYEAFLDDRGKILRPSRMDALDKVVTMIMELPLTSPPAEKIIYSDPGYILLGYILEKAGGASLSTLLDDMVTSPMRLADTTYNPLKTLPHCDSGRIVSTGHCSLRGGEKVGEVEDLNCFILSGIGGHAGIFSTGNDLVTFSRELLKAISGDSLYITKEEADFLLMEVTDRSGMRRRVGFDVPSGEDSLAGKHFSRDSAGHLGFTGVSLWLDLSRQVGMIFLTNRVYRDGDREKFDSFRKRVHDGAWELIGG